MRYWLYTLLLLVLGACQGDSPSGERSTPYSIPDAQNIRSDFSVRLADSTQKTLTETTLSSTLPKVFGPYQDRRTEQASFSGRSARFSQGSAIYHMAEGQYLAIKLSDYARDSSAFLHLFDQYQQIESAAFPIIEGRKIELPLSQTFGWSWKDSQTEVLYLSAGVMSRFHVQLQTNRPSGIVALEDAFRRIDWEKLERETEKSN